jgi:hypothetical protein
VVVKILKVYMKILSTHRVECSYFVVLIRIWGKPRFLSAQYLGPVFSVACRWGGGGQSSILLGFLVYILCCPVCYLVTCFKVAPQLYSQGSVDPVPTLLALLNVISFKYVQLMVFNEFPTTLGQTFMCKITYCNIMITLTQSTRGT